MHIRFRRARGLPATSARTQSLNGPDAGTTFIITFAAAAGGPGEITGTLNLTQAANTIAAAGTVNPISGALNVTEVNNTLSAMGGTLVVGTLSLTEANDTLAAAATVASPGVTATLAITQAGQTLVAWRPGCSRNIQRHATAQNTSVGRGDCCWWYARRHASCADDHRGRYSRRPRHAGNRRGE